MNVSETMKELLSDLYSAKLIDVDPEQALERIQKGREQHREELIPQHKAALSRLSSTAKTYATKRLAAEDAVAKAEQAKRAAQGKLSSIVSEEIGMMHSLESEVALMERRLKELSDPIFPLVMKELDRICDLSRGSFQSAEWRTSGTWHKVTHITSNANPVNAVVDGAKLVRDRIEQLQLEPRPDNLRAHLKELVKPITENASLLDIKTQWPWGSKD